MKTSISLDEKIFKAIDNYRRKQPKIPKLSEAIRDLLWKSLIPKKEITKIPKDYILFKNKTVSIEKSRGRFLIRFNPQDLKKLQEKGFNPQKNNKVNVTIMIYTKGGER